MGGGADHALGAGDAAVIIPPALAAAARRAAEPALAEWVAGLAAVVAAVREHWRLDVGPPLRPGGQGSWVAPVIAGRTAHGELTGDVVVKIGFRHPEAEGEAAGLRLLDGRGAVRLFDSWRDEHTVALLLERCRPGAPLARRPEPEQDEVVARALRRAWSTDIGGVEFRPLEQMCRQWAQGFWRRYAAGPNVDRGLAAEAMTEWRRLAEPSASDAFLVTDLHAGNILAATREPWLVIDPKPYLGDRAYDLGQHLLNCSERLRTDPGALCDRLADLTDQDRDRVRRWMFARCVIEALDEPALEAVARQLAG